MPKRITNEQTAEIDSWSRMLDVNRRQKAFYESRHVEGAERGLGKGSKIWRWLQTRLWAYRRRVGLDEQVSTLHRHWLDDLGDARVLDLGCGRGNALSLWLAETSADYTAIDLSAPAMAALEQMLRERGLTHARARAQDFLDSAFPDDHFDVVYAIAVLHHFEGLDVVLDELRRVLKPGGVLVSYDPLATEPLNRLARIMYRPLQTSRAWEWPFSRATFSLLGKYFHIEEVQGVLGMAKFGYPFALVPGLAQMSDRIARWGMRLDRRYARRIGLPLFLCWHVTLLLRKPLSPDADGPERGGSPSDGPRG